MKRLLIVTCFLVDSFASAAEVPRKPNVLIFLADDLGYADIGANGCQDIPTPHIDAIASQRRALHRWLRDASASARRRGPG